MFGHETWILKKSSRRCILTLFLSHGVEIELIFALQAAFLSYGSIFKISLFRHDIWNLKKVSKFAYVLSTPWGSKLILLLLYGQLFSRYGQIFKISMFGHEIWNLKTGPKVAYVFPFYPNGSKLILFWLYGQPFSR